MHGHTCLQLNWSGCQCASWRHGLRPPTPTPSAPPSSTFLSLSSLLLLSTSYFPFPCLLSCLYLLLFPCICFPASWTSLVEVGLQQTLGDGASCRRPRPRPCICACKTTTHARILHACMHALPQRPQCLRCDCLDLKHGSREKVLHGAPQPSLGVRCMMHGAQHSW